MTPADWTIATGVVLLALGSVGLLAVARASVPRAPVRWPALDPGRAWARCAVDVAAVHGRFEVRDALRLVPEDREGARGWRLVTLTDGGATHGRWLAHEAVEDALLAWWRSPQGRRAVVGGGR